MLFQTRRIQRDVYTDRLIDNEHTTTILSTCRISLIQISVCSTCFVYEYRRDFFYGTHTTARAFLNICDKL